MAYNFARAVFHVPGDVTTASVRRALLLLECRYNLSAWLFVERDWREWEQLVRYVSLAFVQIGNFSSRTPGDEYFPYERLNSHRTDAYFTHFNETFARLITDQRLVLRVRRVVPAGSALSDIAGLSEPLTELVKQTFSIRERAEGRRHAQEMHWRIERDSDQAYRHKELENALSSLRQIDQLKKDGVLDPQMAQALIDNIIPLQRDVEDTLIAEQIDYVDDSMREIEE